MVDTLVVITSTVRLALTLLDPDRVNGSIHYEWDCTISESGDCNYLLSTSDIDAELNTSTLNDGDILVVTLTGTKDQRTSTAQTIVEIIEGNPPIISIGGVPISGIVSSSESLTLYNNYPDPLLSYRWEVFPNDSSSFVYADLASNFESSFFGKIYPFYCN
jgi:hypothetical protein